MFDTVQEIAIYIHRFHNLDLFKQGWYQMKIRMRWENDCTSYGTPSRVVQYESPDLRSDMVGGAWRIDDKDNSFLTQPFRIRYARQDVRLSTMISFTLPLGKHKSPPTCAVIVKFELLQVPAIGERPDLLPFLDASSVAAHEFRIPPKALLGLHCYCPVCFDSFHYVLVDVSVHMSLLKAASSVQVPSNSYIIEDGGGESSDEINQAVVDGASVDMKQIMFVKALLVARDTLLEELQRISKAIDQTIDLTAFTSVMNDMNSFGPILQNNLGAAATDVSTQLKSQKEPEKANGTVDFRSEILRCTLSKDSAVSISRSLGAHLLYLWSNFLQFHRAHRTKILEFLYDAWSRDQKAEWSIWMVYSRTEMPHHYIKSENEDSSHKPHRVSSLWKLHDDPARSAASQAELHRRSIGQMKMNNRSIQDMYVYGDPLRNPIIIVERVINAPRRTFSERSYFINFDLLIESPRLVPGPRNEAGKKPSLTTVPSKGRQLKIVVFVHGFQGHHLDLRLVRNQWLLIDPKMEFLMSEINEEKTSGDFREMGLRLAKEVVSFIKTKVNRAPRSGPGNDIKLSFVGHSIGNVIIRSALADRVMEPYLKYLHTYVSISGPHLGYLYSSNSLFNSGMWVLKKLKGTRCFHQLTFTDDPHLENTFFYKLSEQKTLEKFRHIILISSPQDGYVPYHSARIELCQAASLDFSKRGRVFLQMLNNCLDQIRAPASEQRLFMRCDVNFDTSAYGRNLNSYIGRAAHIEFLESDAFVKFIMWSFLNVFR